MATELVRCHRCDERVPGEMKGCVIIAATHRYVHGLSCVGWHHGERCQLCFDFKQRQLDLFSTRESSEETPRT